MKVAARRDESERLDRALLAIFHPIGNHALAFRSRKRGDTRPRAAEASEHEAMMASLTSEACAQVRESRWLVGVDEPRCLPCKALFYSSSRAVLGSK